MLKTKTNWKYVLSILAFVGVLFGLLTNTALGADAAMATGGHDWARYIWNFLWILVAALGYTIGIGISIWIFDLISTKIEEWEEIKKGNIGVAIIFLSLVIMNAVLITVVFSNFFSVGVAGIEYSYLELYLMAIGWAIVVSVGYSICIGLAIWVFDLLSTTIEEWEEIKKGNIGVALIFTSLIVMSAIILLQAYGDVASQSPAAADNSIWLMYLNSLGWGLIDTIGYVFSIGLAIKVFDLISVDIEEWDEIKKGNFGVSLIFIALIVMAGFIIAFGAH